ncbi:MAG: hypothetical protein ACTTIM_01855 [Campylobacter sp.]
MEKLFKVIASAFLLFSLSATTAFADSAKGQKYYLKYMRDVTGMKGDKFTSGHTQAEWEALFAGSAEKFVEEYSKQYPSLKEFFESDKFPKFMPHIKDFCIEYAADSGKVPHC